MNWEKLAAISLDFLTSMGMDKGLLKRVSESSHPYRLISQLGTVFTLITAALLFSGFLMLRGVEEGMNRRGEVVAWSLMVGGMLGFFLGLFTLNGLVGVIRIPALMLLERIFTAEEERLNRNWRSVAERINLANRMALVAGLLASSALAALCSLLALNDTHLTPISVPLFMRFGVTTMALALCMSCAEFAFRILLRPFPKYRLEVQ